jgi:molecular chaperone GrpE
VARVDPLGEPFDPNFHQAVTVIESTTAEPGSVLQVLQPGFTLHGRVVRPAMVMVAKAPAPPAADPS